MTLDLDSIRPRHPDEERERLRITPAGAMTAEDWELVRQHAAKDAKKRAGKVHWWRRLWIFKKL